MCLYMENILQLEYVGTSTRYFLVYRAQNNMRKNVQIGVKSKKIDYNALFLKISSNQLHTLQSSAENLRLK